MTINQASDEFRRAFSHYGFFRTVGVGEGPDGRPVITVWTDGGHHPIPVEVESGTWKGWPLQVRPVRPIRARRPRRPRSGADHRSPVAT